MSTLAIDTCLGACSVAVQLRSAAEEKRVISRAQRMDAGHAEALAPMIAAVMAEAGLAFSALTRIAVTIGPGTFTGTRIGIAAARGLALALDIPVVGATSLAVLAETAVMITPGGPPSEILAVVDARRGEVYAGLYVGDGSIERMAPRVVPVAEAAKMPATNGVVVAGTGAQAVLAAGLSCRGVGRVFADLQPDARALLRLAQSFEPANEPVRPLYLRAPDAKPQSVNSLSRL